MDPIIIVGALIAAIANLAEPAVNDAYQGLKALIVAKYNANVKLQGALAGAEEDADTWQKPLESSLSATDIKDDAEIATATEKLQSVLKETNAVIPPGINVEWRSGNISGGNVIVAGTSGSQISINAEKKDDRKK